MRPPTRLPLTLSRFHAPPPLPRRLNYTAAIKEGRELSKALDKLMEQELESVRVKDADRKSATFRYADRGLAIDDFGEGGEYEYRHPGTSCQDDAEKMLHDYDDYDNGLSPITTKAGQHLLALSFAGAAVGGPAPQAELRSTYPLQLTIRVDNQRKALNFDCFEYSPSSMDLDEPTDLPSVRLIINVLDSALLERYRPLHRTTQLILCVLIRSIHRFERCAAMRSLVGYAKTETDAQAVQPDRGSFATSDRAVLLLQATAGDLMASRMLRFRLNISSITGARLVKPSRGPSVLSRGPEQTRVSLAALILEVNAPPATDAFAARLVHSKNERENRFVVVPDWTPDQVGFTPTRDMRLRLALSFEDSDSVCAPAIPDAGSKQVLENLRLWLSTGAARACRTPGYHLSSLCCPHRLLPGV